MLSPLRLLYLALISFIVEGCSPQSLSVSWQSIGKVRGTVMPLMTGQSMAFSCTSPRVDLYLLDSQGKKVMPSLGTSKVDSSGRYQINLLSGQLNLSQRQLLEVTGCSDILSRAVTEEANQDISYGTSLVTWMTKTSQAQKFISANNLELSSLLKNLSVESSYPSAYNNIANGQLSPVFQGLFSTTAQILLDAPPEIIQVNVPTTINENSNANVGVLTKHWSSSYQAAYKWKFEDGVVGNTSNTSVFANKNQQGLRLLTLSYGQKQVNTSDLDEAKPFLTQSFAIQVNDTFPVKVPVMSLINSHVTNNATISLTFDSGIGGVNCETFSRIAIIADSLSAQFTDANFQAIDCSSGGIQTIQKAISGEGAHTLYIWTKDSSGQISNTADLNVPQILNVTLDTVAPPLVLTAPLSGATVPATFTLTGTCEADASFNLGQYHGLPLTIEETTTLPAVLLAQPTCGAGGTFSQAITLSSGDGRAGLTRSLCHRSMAPEIQALSPEPFIEIQAHLRSPISRSIAVRRARAITFFRSPFSCTMPFQKLLNFV